MPWAAAEHEHGAQGQRGENPGRPAPPAARVIPVFEDRKQAEGKGGCEYWQEDDEQPVMGHPVAAVDEHGRNLGRHDKQGQPQGPVLRPEDERDCGAEDERRVRDLEADGVREAGEEIRQQRLRSRGERGLGGDGVRQQGAVVAESPDRRGADDGEGGRRGRDGASQSAGCERDAREPRRETLGGGPDRFAVLPGSTKGLVGENKRKDEQALRSSKEQQPQQSAD